MDVAMSRRSLAAALGALALLAATSPASAWTPRYHEQVAVQGARLMPGSLQTVLAQHQDRLRAGALAPLKLGANESLYLHAGGSYGTLDQSILVQSQRVLDLLQSRSGFDVVVYEMGVLSHLVALANCPTNVAADDPREPQWGPRFQSYAESRIPKFRVVFDGYLTQSLANDDVRGFARSITDRSRKHYPLIARAYLNEDGSVKSNASFSDQHAVFGIASLAYSRSIADTAKIWLYLWIKADGDTTNLPFPQGLSQPTLVKANRQ
jgi:hypothetical protein